MKYSVAILLCSLGFISCESETEPPTTIDEKLALSGGTTTIFTSTSTAFGTPAPNLEGDRMALHLAGDGAFGAQFVSAPASVQYGLGPIFNSNSCESCHPKDGRGKPPESGAQLSSLLLRISIDGVSAHGGPVPVPGYGLQLQQRSTFGIRPEANVSVVYEETEGQFADGEFYSLRKPVYSLNTTYKELPPGVRISPRLAPPVFGLGLLEAISEQTILAKADENDIDGDGISGKANYAWDAVKEQQAIGRFGWKAANPSLYQQTAGAYVEDMGVTNPLFKLEACHDQEQIYGQSTDDPEIDLATLEAATFYVRTLAVPARRNLGDQLAQRGEKLFASAGCNRCHLPEVQTGTLDGVPEVSNQTIRPYTDLLVHDMGEGLSDNRSDFRATGREWRTAPLWGIGLTQVVSGHTSFLHDGRARNLIEAIMWHGGEAETAKEYFRTLSKSDREALLAFLKSL